MMISAVYVTCYVHTYVHTHVTMPHMFLSLQCVCHMHVTHLSYACDTCGSFKLWVVCTIQFFIIMTINLKVTDLYNGSLVCYGSFYNMYASNSKPCLLTIQTIAAIYVKVVKFFK